MPLPWLFNQWACNPFAAEPGREAATDQARTGGVRGPSLADVLGETPKAEVGEEAAWETGITAAEWYDVLVKNWPAVPNVIPPEERVTSGHLHDVKDFVNDPVRHSGPERTKLECFDYAHYQVFKDGFMPSGRADRSPETMWLLYEYAEPGGVRTEIPVSSLVEAITYIKDRLHSGVPVLVGVRINGWSKRPNQLKSTPFIETTNHYVVVVGMGSEGDKYYFNFYDYRHEPNADDRLVLQRDMTMVSPDGYCTLSELRRMTAR